MIGKFFQYSVLGVFLLGAPVAQANELQQTQVQPSTQIITDNEKNIIQFFINGEEAMRLDETGLHVRESIIGSNTMSIPHGYFESYISETEDLKDADRTSLPIQKELKK